MQEQDSLSKLSRACGYFFRPSDLVGNGRKPRKFHENHKVVWSGWMSRLPDGAFTTPPFLRYSETIRNTPLGIL